MRKKKKQTQKSPLCGITEVLMLNWSPGVPDKGQAMGSQEGL